MTQNKTTIQDKQINLENRGLISTETYLSERNKWKPE